MSKALDFSVWAACAGAYLGSQVALVVLAGLVDNGFVVGTDSEWDSFTDSWNGLLDDADELAEILGIAHIVGK